MPHGEWEAWLEKNCPEVSDRTARLYIRLAKNSDKVEKAAEENGNAVADLSVRGAAKLLATPQTEEQKAVRAAKRTAKKAEAEAALAALKAEAKSPDLTQQLKAIAPDEVFKALKDAAWGREELTKLVSLLNAHLEQMKPRPSTGAPPQSEFGRRPLPSTTPPLTQ